jgi:hypothetical protein
VAEQRCVDRVRQQLLVTAAAGNLTEQIEWPEEVAARPATMTNSTSPETRSSSTLVKSVAT